MKKNYTLSAKALWHLHIGAGAEHKVDPLGYVMKEYDGKPWFYRIDIPHMMAVDTVFAAEFLRLVDQANAIGGLRTLVLDAFDPEDRQSWIHRAAVAASVWRTYKTKIQGSAFTNQLLIQCMPFSAGRVYIPGSSVKGVLRTAVLDTLAQKNGYSKTLSAAKSTIRRPSELSAAVEKELLHYNRIQDDPFKTLKVQDSILSADATEIVEVCNVPQSGGDPISLDMFVEAVKPGTRFTITIGIGDAAGLGKIDLKVTGIGMPELLQSANAYFLNAINEEAEEHYPEDSPADRKVQDALAEVLDENSEPIPDKSLLRIGRFSHLESMTYNRRGKGRLCEPQRYNRKTGEWEMKYGTTRNLVDGEYPLGAVVVSY